VAPAALRGFDAYVQRLDRSLRSLFLPPVGLAVARGQIGAVVVLSILDATFGLPLLVVWLAMAIFAPHLWLRSRRSRRVREIDAMLDGFVVALANALKTTPSIGDAIASVEQLARGPLAEELSLVIRDMRLGSTLEQALGAMQRRVESAQLDMALLPVLVGRQVGGNLPRILEVTAGTMREMARLAGVVRTKTAEGRLQLWVLSVFPFFIVLGLATVSPGYFGPMTSSPIGLALLGVAVVLWAAAIIVGSRILAMEV
jgi:tight adherence protein B